MIAFSTCWNSQKHSDGLAMIEEILDLGFDTIEISHGLKVSLLPGIIKAFEERIIKVAGVHNFCPSPVEVLIDAPDCYEFTSHRERERKRAIDLTLATIRTAERFNAKYIVMHLGSIPMKRISPKLEKLAANDELDSKSYGKLKAKLIKKRQKIAPLYIERASSALAEVLAEASKNNIVLGIESRSAYEDLPNEDELIDLMNHYKNKPEVGYWHDFGHVHRKHNLGLLDHGEWLSKMKPHIKGCHLHDVKWPHRDHQVPFKGQINYPELFQHIPDGIPIVWELSHRRKKEEIQDSFAEWNSIFNNNVQ
jgi:sugar phosphate isomerase/epimerase